MKQILFLEGPAYAGKTTFLRGLNATAYAIAEEASEFLGGDNNFPEAPTDAKSMVYCSYFFGHMEHLRLVHLDDKKVTVADRFTPLSSLIFYYLRYKGGHVPRPEYLRGLAMSALVFQEQSLPLDMQSGFLLFTISSREEFQRRLSRGTRNADFNEWDNFMWLSNFYEAVLPHSAPKIVDGTFDQTLLESIMDNTVDARKLLDARNFADEVDHAELERARLEHQPTGYISETERLAIVRRVEDLVHGR